MRALDILDHVESLSGKKDKVEFLKSHNTNQELKELLHAALSFSRKYHIKKFEVRHDPRVALGHGDFMNMLDDLENRVVTGNDAIDRVEATLELGDDQQRKWYPRILRKDLKAGFDISTANKAGFDIPKFDVMLAKDGNSCKKLGELVKEGVWCSPKLDGYRCIAQCSFGTVTLHSRNGTEYQNFPAIVSTLEEWCKESSFVLDGEIMSDDFNSMQQSAFASKRGTAVGDVKFHVFGLIPTDEWNSDKFKTLTSHRLNNLQMLMDKNDDKNPGNIEFVEQTCVYTVERIMELQAEYESKGYEGVMVLPNVPYFRGRKSNKLMKFKSMHSQDCEVTGVYEGTGKYEGLLGGMHLLQEDGVTKCDVGSGFTDADREFIWNNPDQVIGRKAEIKFQELTPDGVMRFPIFMRWRDDK
jgi:DNA ligase-1